jgi:hypothetical protein
MQPHIARIVASGRVAAAATTFKTSGPFTVAGLNPPEGSEAQQFAINGTN